MKALTPLSGTACWVPGRAEVQGLLPLGEPLTSFPHTVHPKDILFRNQTNTETQTIRSIRTPKPHTVPPPAVFHKKHLLPFRILQVSDLQCKDWFFACWKSLYKNAHGQGVRRHCCITSQCPSCFQLLLTGFLPQVLFKRSIWVCTFTDLLSPLIKVHRILAPC